MKHDDLTPEQQEAVVKAFASLSESMAKILSQVAEAIKPIMEAYNALPQDVKMKLAEYQVKEDIENITAPLTKPDRDQWIINKLETEYKQYWNEEQQRYIIIEPGQDQGDGTATGDEIWKPTRDELVADLEKSYDFEFGS